MSPDRTVPTATGDKTGLAVPAGGCRTLPRLLWLRSASVARRSLVIASNDDVDLFLRNTSGNIIAISGTDELIEIVQPAAGIYTMVVHGTSIPGDPPAYPQHLVGAVGMCFR